MGTHLCIESGPTSRALREEAAHLPDSSHFQTAAAAGTFGALDPGVRTEAVMLENATYSTQPNPNQLGLAARSCFRNPTANRVEWAALSRDARLLDASIAGVVLSFNPRDDEMRESAE